MMFLGGGPGGGASNHGQHVHGRSSPTQSAQKSGRHRRDDHQPTCAPRRPGIPGVTALSAVLAGAQHRRRGSPPRSTSTRSPPTASTTSNEWAPKLMAAMQKLPELKDVATDQQDNGLRAQLVIDRDTASRLGVSPLTIDATLSDAFGQRQVSTTYKPLNQYHVVMEVAQQFQQRPRRAARTSTSRAPPAHGPALRRHPLRDRSASRSPSTTRGRSPAATLSFNLTPGARSQRGHRRHRAGARRDRHAVQRSTAASRAPRRPSRHSLSTEPVLILLALVTVYIVLGILYESYHPSAHHSLDAALGRRRRAARAAALQGRPLASSP